MGKWSVTVLAVLVVACAIGIVWPVFRNREPVYKGKPLSEWLHGYRWELSATTETQARKKQADEAVKAAGPKAIPTLLRLLDHRESKLERLWTYLKARIGPSNQ